MRTAGQAGLRESSGMWIRRWSRCFVTLGAVIVAVSAAASTVVFGLPTAAFAAGGNGVCEIDEVCFYYHTNRQGSVADFHADLPSDSNLSDNKFISPGAGQGQTVDNNAQSVCNWNPDEAVYLAVDAFFRGGGLILPRYTYVPRCSMDLGAYRNRISSYRFYVR
jgi:hypothetical protein